VFTRAIPAHFNAPVANWRMFLLESFQATLYHYHPFSDLARHPRLALRATQRAFNVYTTGMPVYYKTTTS
jgi:hypothetical protein